MALWISQPPFIAHSAQDRFAVRHFFTLVLVAAITVILATPLLAAEGPAPLKPVLSPGEAKSLAQAGAVTIIDVRRPDEWRATGIAAGAQRATIDYGRGTSRFLARIRKLTKGDKNMPIALICAAGVRSNHAARLLRRNGYTAVADIGEGMTGGARGIGWIKRGLPVAPCGSC